MVAEREGFEPSVEVSPYDGLANRCLRPLGHLSSILFSPGYRYGYTFTSLAVVKSIVKCLDKSFHGLRLPRRGDMAIAFQHPQARPSAPLLHSSQVDSAGNESRGECVAGGVRGHIVETGAGTGRLKPGAKRSIGDTRSGCKDEFTGGLSFQARMLVGPPPLPRTCHAPLRTEDPFSFFRSRPIPSRSLTGQ